jgi:hypothetical protein
MREIKIDFLELTYHSDIHSIFCLTEVGGSVVGVQIGVYFVDTWQRMHNNRAVFAIAHVIHFILIGTGTSRIQQTRSQNEAVLNFFKLVLTYNEKLPLTRS